MAGAEHSIHWPELRIPPINLWVMPAARTMDHMPRPARRHSSGRDARIEALARRRMMLAMLRAAR